jgi:hypothetical protein
MREELPPGVGRVMFGAVDSDGLRVSAAIEIRDMAGELIYEGTTNDVRFDTNDHLNVKVQLAERYEILVRHAAHSIHRTVKFERGGVLTMFEFTENR